MKLKRLLHNISRSKIYNLKNIDIKGICTDSRFIKKGELFIALKGFSVDGHSYINDAIRCGAVALVLEKKIALDLKVRASQIVLISVSDTKRALIDLAANFYQDKIRGLKLIGITGTNGKTTITYFVESILNRAHIKSGLIGTIDYHFGGRHEIAVNTTPALNELYKYFLQMKKANVGYVIMEVTSQALAQGRVDGLYFSQALFTNLTRDHLDYHRDFKGYFAAKRKLFTKLKGRQSWAIINVDDTYGRRLLRLKLPRKISYGINRLADVRALDIELNKFGGKFLISYKGKTFPVQTKLLGLHNVYNILAAAALCLTMDIHPSHIREGIRDIEEIPGRLQLAGKKGNVRIFVDYAHTHEALRQTLNTLRLLREAGKRERIILVFGCGGERDKIKRPLMGKIASRLADVIILTTDNPRSENSMGIIKDIKRGLSGVDFLIVEDRYKAIKKAISLARGSDIVIIAGKGHEQLQIYNNRIVDFNDAKVVRAILRKIKVRYV